VPTIVGELKRHFRDTGWAVRVPQRIQARALEFERASNGLSRRLGRAPTAREVSEATGASLPEVLEAAEAAIAFDTVSLESGGRNGDGERQGIGEAFGRDDDRYELIEFGATIGPALRALPPRERQILRMRFVEDMTQLEIGRRLGISQMHVSRLMRRALARLRAVAGSG
jgi:RNA polymerase sigma-B factor